MKFSLTEKKKSIENGQWFIVCHCSAEVRATPVEPCYFICSLNLYEIKLYLSKPLLFSPCCNSWSPCALDGVISDGVGWGKDCILLRDGGPWGPFVSCLSLGSAGHCCSSLWLWSGWKSCATATVNMQSCAACPLLNTRSQSGQFVPVRESCFPVRFSMLPITLRHYAFIWVLWDVLLSVLSFCVSGLVGHIWLVVSENVTCFAEMQ